MLKLRDLATRSDFEAGPLYLSPSTRRVRGPAGEIQLEPLIMQVFLLLVDAEGRVVTRDEFFDQCWGGVIVGDDSLNRAIAKIRRIASEVAPRCFEIETIPRTGYRLTGKIIDHLQASSSGNELKLPRRAMIGGGAAAAVVLAGPGLWWAQRPRSEARFDALMARGEEAIHDGAAFYDLETSGIYEEAVRANPQSAAAWGLLAYSTSVRLDESGNEDSGRLVEKTQNAAHRALALNPNEPNARLAMFALEGPMLDWASRDRLLRGIVSTDPRNVLAIGELMTLLQAAGLTRESWAWNERILALAPLSKPYLVVRALKLWLLGKVAAADKVIDRVRGLWPLDQFGYFVRFLLFSLTGRTDAALAMLASNPKLIGSSDEVALWRAALPALDDPSPKALATAREACVNVARKVPWITNDAVMILCALNQIEEAFDLTDGYLLWRGKVISADQANGRVVNDYSRRMTQWLFSPPAAAMRSDPRFLQLCNEFGLVAYWNARHVKPDYLVYG